MSLKFLIRYAYNLPNVLLEGGPAWIDTKTFDITATTDGVPPVDDANLNAAQRERYGVAKWTPVRDLLETRFALKMHKEKRTKPYFALVQSKAGFKAKQPEEGKDGKPPRSGFSMGRGRLHAYNVTMDKLAAYLTTSGASSDDIDRPIQDETGIAGTYDVEVTWTPGMSPDGLSLFTALEQQVGLRLEQKKGPVEMTVIDSATLPSID